MKLKLIIKVCPGNTFRGCIYGYVRAANQPVNPKLFSYFLIARQKGEA